MGDNLLTPALPEDFIGKIRDAWLIALPSLLLCIIFDFVGGTVLGKYFDKLMFSYPILLVVLPGLMGLRGNIFGALASRFTTALYLGEMRASLKEKMVLENISLSVFLSLLPIGVLWVIGAFKIPNICVNLIALLILIVSTIVVSLLLGYSAAAITIVPFKRGVDPDLIAAPLITSIADLLTIPVLIIFLLIFEFYWNIFLFLFAFFFFLLIYIFHKYRFNRKAFFEISGALTVLSIISSISGALLESYSEIIYKTAILSVIYPAILDSLGNYGAIIAARTSTKLHLGEFKGIFDLKILRDIVSLLTTGIIISVSIYFTGFYITVIVLNKSVVFFPQFIFFYIMLLFLVMFLSSIFASIFHRMRLDPDNISIPAITTISDLIGTIYVVFIAYMMLH